MHHVQVGAVVNGVDAGQVGWVDLVGAVGLETLEVHLVLDLAHNVDVCLAPLVGRGHLSGCSPFFLGRVLLRLVSRSSADDSDEPEPPSR